MDQSCKVERKDRVSMDRHALHCYLDEVNGNGDMKAVMEACYGWDYFYNELEGKVQEIKLAHAMKTRAIADARIKTDSIDSETLLDRNHIEQPGFRELSNKFGKKGRSYMKGFKLKWHDTRIVPNYLSMIEKIEEKVASIDKRIKSAFQEDDIFKLLKTIPGIGEFSTFICRGVAQPG